MADPVAQLVRLGEPFEALVAAEGFDVALVQDDQSVLRVESGQDGSAPLVNATFAKFAQALTPAKMEHFDSLAAILKYLKMCVHSVVADEVRSRQSRQYEETLELIEQEPASDDPADDVVSNISAQGLWQVIQEELNGEDERMLIYLAYIQGMKPSEISSQHRRFFPTVDDVYRIKRNVLERLRRNRRLQMMFRHHHL